MHVITQILGIISTKYRDDTALVALADALVLAQRQANALSPSGRGDTLEGYRLGAQAVEGYSTPTSVSAAMFANPMAEVSALFEITVLTRVTVVALQRMGEEIDY